MKFLLTFLFIIYCAVCSGRIVNPHEVEVALHHAGADMNRINVWLCIVGHSSQFRTDVVIGGNFGLFQIPSVWCGHPHGGCDLPCQALLDDNIFDDAICAVRIYNEAVASGHDGFQPWAAFKFCGGIP